MKIKINNKTLTKAEDIIKAVFKKIKNSELNLDSYKHLLADESKGEFKNITAEEIDLDSYITTYGNGFTAQIKSPTNDDEANELFAYIAEIIINAQQHNLKQPQVNQQPQPQVNQQAQQNQQDQVQDELSEELKKKYNFPIHLYVDWKQKIDKFKKVNEVYGGNNSDEGNIFKVQELGDAFYCNNNGNQLHINTEQLNKNLEGDKEQDWWNILSDLGFYWGNDSIKIKEPALEQVQNNADVVANEGLNRKAIKQKIEEVEKGRLLELKSLLELQQTLQIKTFSVQQSGNNGDQVTVPSYPQVHDNNQVLNNQVNPQVNPQGGGVPGNGQPLNFPNPLAILGLPFAILGLPFYGLWYLLNRPQDLSESISKINFDEIVKNPTYIFDVKKYSSLLEIVANSNDGGSYHFQLDKDSKNQGNYYQAIYNLIEDKPVNHNFKADDDIQTKLNKLLGAKNIEKWNQWSSNDAKKDAIINKNPNAYSYSYYRDAGKNTDINVNFGLLQNDINNQDDFEKLIYQQGVKSEFFVKVYDDAEKYVKFSLYWDKEAKKPAIQLAKSPFGNKNIMLYGSNQELCGSVVKDTCCFKDMKVSFQLYYNRGKNILNNDINKSLCFINETAIGDFFNSSQASNLELNSDIVTTTQATKKMTEQKKEFTKKEKQEIIEKINSHLESELKKIFVKPADQSEQEYDNNIKLITDYLKNQNEIEAELNLNPNNVELTEQQSQELAEIKEALTKIKPAIDELKAKYQGAVKKIDPNYFDKPAHSISGQEISSQNNEQNQQQINLLLT